VDITFYFVPLLYLENVKAAKMQINAHFSAHVYTTVHDYTQRYTKMGEIMSREIIECLKNNINIFKINFTQFWMCNTDRVAY